MKDTSANEPLEVMLQKYIDLKKRTDDSILTFCKKNKAKALEAFLFHTRLGEFILKNISSYRVDKKLEELKGIKITAFNIEHSHRDEAARIKDLLEDENFEDYLKTEFSLSLQIKRIDRYLKIIIEE